MLVSSAPFWFLDRIMWGKNSNTSKNASSSDVEVEVSLDLLDNLYSIVVTEGKRLQSVVSVPTESRNRTSRRRFLGGAIVKNSSDDFTARMMAADSSSHRLADSLRPLSPNMSDRHSALEDSSRDRGRGASCPPSVDRHSRRSFTSRPETPRCQRLQSCPPNNNRRHGKNEREYVTPEVEARTPRESCRSSCKSKKPNLVSKTASRNRLFGSTGSRKVIPAPTAVR